jgi:tetratricopeptide (TPR) repeat protein
LKAYIKNERVIRLYTGLSSVVENRVKEKSLSRPLLDEIKPRITEKADKKIKTEISAVAHEKKGDIYEKEGRDFLAIEEYRQAVKQGINHPDLFRKLAITLYNLGLVDDAIIEMEKAVKLSSNKDFLITMELGILYLAKDRIEKAKEQFFAVLGMNPGFADAYYYLGELFLREKDYDMAWLSVKMAQRLGHRGQNLVRKLGDLSKEPGVDPWNESGEDLYIRQILVDTYEKAEDIVNRISGGELFEDLAGSESMEPNASLGGFVGHFNPLELHPKIAEALLERGVLTDPVIVETERGFHIVQRIIPFDFNFWEKLLSDSDKVSTENDESAEADYNLGLYYGTSGKHQEAIKAFKQAIRTNPDYAETHYNLGVAYDKSGMYKEAIEAYKQAIRVNPDYAEAHVNLGVIYGKSGMYQEAIKAYKQAIRVNPDYAEAHVNLGVIYGKLGMNKEAIEALKQAIRINPDYADAHYNLGFAYLMLNDENSALEEYKILKDLDTEFANRLFKEIYK